MSSKPTVFLSYSWNDSVQADEIDNHFKESGLLFQRDVRDIAFKESIKEFMQRVGDSDYVIMLISDSFLNSQFCMYEVVELMKDRNFANRMIQVILDNDILDLDYRIDLIRKWNIRIHELDKKVSEIPIGQLGPLAEEVKLYSDIGSNISTFMNELAIQKSVSYEYLKGNEFEELKSFMGIAIKAEEETQSLSEVDLRNKLRNTTETLEVQLEGERKIKIVLENKAVDLKEEIIEVFEQNEDLDEEAHEPRKKFLAHLSKVSSLTVKAMVKSFMDYSLYP